MLIDTGSKYKKNIWQYFLIIVFLFITHPYTLAQTTTIKSVVLDKITKEPLTGANVIIQGTNLGAAADLDGRFIIRNVPIGKQTLVISYIGYNSLTVELNVSSSGIEEQSFYLEPKTLEGETVVITGQAQGQLSAINQQLSSNTISNIVSENRIRELPDVNAAESIGRLPGVSISRSGGEANKISIRGLSPKYNTVTVNGVRLPSTDGADRSVDLSLISSTMLAGIEVKKANTPDMDADALGGSVDLRLKEASENLEIDVSAQGGYNKLQDYYGNYNFKVSVSNRFLDNDLGIIASFNLDDYNRSADKFSGDYRQTTLLDGSTGIITQGISLRDEQVTRGRVGASFLLDYRIPNGKLTANSFYNKLNWDGTFRLVNYNLNDSRHNPAFEIRGGTTSIFTGAIGVEQDLGWFSYDLGVAQTASRGKNPDERRYMFTVEGGAFDYTNGAPTINTHPREVPGYATNDTTLIGIQDIYRYDTDRDENQTTVQLNFKVPFELSDFISGYLKTGAKFRWLDRMNNQDQYGRNGLYYGNGNGPNSFLTKLDEAIPEWGVDALVTKYGRLPIFLFKSDYKRTDFLNGEYPLGFQADFGMLNRMYQALEDSGQFISYGIGTLGDDYEGVEHYQAGYLMAEVNFGKMITLIPGFRYENDYSRYRGQRFREAVINNQQAPPTDLDTIVAVRSYGYFLPMIHLIIEPADWIKIRLARTATLTRPDYNQYAPISRINSQQDYIRAANSNLKPAKSTNYDISVSVYENYIGLFTVSGFHKSIDGLIFQYNYPINPDIPVLEGMNLPAGWLTRPVQYGADTYINNENKAIYYGFELDWQTYFWYLPSFLKGIVLNVNYTRIFSEMDKSVFLLRQTDRRKPGGGPPRYYMELVDTIRSSRLPDQPGYIANITIGYDFQGFSARLSYLYQADKVTYIDRKEVLDQFTGPYSRWDLTLQQKIIEGLQIFANFTNLNNRPDESFRGKSFNNPTYLEYYGFTMDIGARYRF